MQDVKLLDRMTWTGLAGVFAATAGLEIPSQSAGLKLGRSFLEPREWVHSGPKSIGGLLGELRYASMIEQCVSDDHETLGSGGSRVLRVVERGEKDVPRSTAISGSLQASCVKGPAGERQPRTYLLNQAMVLFHA